MMKAEPVSSQGSQVESWKEGKVVLYQEEGMEEPYQAAVGKAASYLEEGGNLKGHRNRAVEACREVNTRSMDKGKLHKTYI